MKRWDDLPDDARLLVDSAPIIYFFERNPLRERFRGFFEAVSSQRLQAVVTPITLAEVATGPSTHGNAILAERYHQSLTAAPGWSLRALDADLAMLAARFRATYRLRLPDAIQLATAVAEGCDGLVTYDRDFPETAGMRIIRGLD